MVTQAANSALNTVSIYLDGTLFAGNCSPTGNTGLNNTIAQVITIGAVYLGALPAPAGRFFQGALDDFYYYNVVLNATQVAQLYYDKCTVQGNTCGTPPPQPTVTPIGCCIGNACSLGSTNPLLTSWRVPLNNFNYVFSGQGPTNNNVGIGTNCNPLAKLEVRENSTNPNSIGVLSINSDIDGVAVRGRAVGNASGVQTKVAGWFETTPAVGAQQTAIYVPQGMGVVNIGYPTPSSVGSGGGLLNVNGDGAFGGDVFPVQGCNPSQRCGNPTNRWFEVWACNGNIQTSDERLKDNIAPLNYGMEAIMKLKPISYTWKNNAEYGRKIGFVAQQLKQVIGEVVREGDDKDKTLGVNYAEMVPVLVKGIQEQQQTIESQQKQIDELKTMVQSLASNQNSTGSKAVPSQAVNLSDKNVIVLNQNVPNPFAESTVITYNIPTDFTKAQISFSKTDGKIIKSVDITSKGEGRLNVFANDLTNGFYTYTLVVDGKIVETKKMVKD